jgi:hypothetical protein
MRKWKSRPRDYASPRGPRISDGVDAEEQPRFPEGPFHRELAEPRHDVGSLLYPRTAP